MTSESKQPNIQPPKCKPLSPGRAWLLATRPKTLMAAVCPVAAGTALAAAHGGFHPGSALAALLGSVFIQIATNFANDYFDHARGSDRPDRKGPARAVASGWITPRSMGAATALMFALALAMMILLVLRAGWPLLVIGLVSVVCGVWYTAGKYALAYLGLGDLFVVVFFGPVAVGGTYYAQVLPSSLDSWWPVLVAGLGPGLIANGLLVVNNLRDIDEDRVSRKRTLAVRFGKTFSRWEYIACILLGSAAPVIAFMLRPDRMPYGVCVSAVAVLAATPAMRGILSGTSGAALNAYLGCTARTLMVFTLLFTLGALLS